MLHPTLERQLKKHGMTVADLPENARSWRQFLDRISRSYTNSDEDHRRPERSLRISSQEMRELYETTRQSSESKIAEDRGKLRASEERYRKLVQTAPEMILILSVDGTIRSLNQAFERLTGLRCDAWLSRPLASLIHPRDLAHADERFQQLLKGQETPAFELRILTASGGYFDAELTMTRLVEGDEISGLLGIARDVTDRNRVRQGLLSAKHAAETASLAKSDFLANMSHEIRTPLNAIIGLTSLLLDKPLAPEVSSYVETIRSSGDTVLALINDILDFSKIESGMMELEEQPFDLRDLLSGPIDLVATEAEQKGLKLSSRLKAGCPDVVIGDVTRVRQILVNLLSNAVKFTHRGEIEVTARCHGCTSESAAGDELELELAVRDTGIGIAPEDMAAVFGSFSQADASTSRKYGGTGLGLAISQRLAGLLGGGIRAESELGRGSTFCCTVRVRYAEKVIRPPSDRPADSGIDRHLGRRMPLRILVAEDNVINQKVVLMLLRRMGYRADLAADGREVIDCLKRQRYDVVLMDVQMPHLDGLEATRRIHRRWPDADRPRIVATTAAVMAGDRERCFRAGMHDFLSKPIRAEDLQATVLRCARALGAEPTAATEHSRDKAGEEGSSADDDIRREDLRVRTDIKLLGPRMLREIIANFLESAEKLETAIRLAVDQRDPAALATAAHELKGASATVGAARMAEICKQMERSGRQGSFGSAEQRLLELRRELDRVSTFFRRHAARAAQSDR